MRKVQFLMLALAATVLFIAGCGGASTSGQKLSTPRIAWDEYVSAMKAGDAQQFHGLLSSSYVTGAAAGGSSAGEVMNKWNSLLSAPATYDQVKLLGIQQGGDQATVRFTFAGHEDYSGQIVLVKEGGQWKIAAGTSMKNTGG